MPTPLLTARLLLRPFTLADADALVALDSDPAVMRFLTGGSPTPRALISDEILPRFLRVLTQAPGLGYWAAEERATTTFLGWFGLVPHDDEPADRAYLGYRLRREAWGHGYATEGACALVDLGFADLGLQRVLATTYQDNHASRRVLEKVGLTLVRAYRCTPADLLAASTFQVDTADIWDGDDLEYGLDEADWRRCEPREP